MDRDAGCASPRRDLGDDLAPLLEDVEQHLALGGFVDALGEVLPNDVALGVEDGPIVDSGVEPDFGLVAVDLLPIVPVDHGE